MTMEVKPPIVYREDIEQSQCLNPECEDGGQCGIRWLNGCCDAVPVEARFEDGILDLICCECNKVCHRVVVASRFSPN